MGRLQHPSNLTKLFEKPLAMPGQDKRRDCRKRCFIEIDYTVRGYSYKGFVQNISESGAYVRSNKARWFFSGEEIALIIPLRILGDPIRGKIAWARKHGMGIVFEKRSAVPIEWKPDTAEVPAPPENRKRAGKIRNKKLRWEPSKSVDVICYRLYWSAKGAVGYESDHVDVGKVTQISLPDDIPSFPLVAGQIELGISAMSRAGNESEITRAIALFDFSLPEAPGTLNVDNE